ncbi:MAG: type I DNA topoisomerase [Eubacteriales bacterium]|nr:type I DNA topoisomerase [Eubacteriales bacterium]
MAYKLLIVESPAKAKTIGRYLGKEYKIAASVGHIRDLPSSTLGVRVDKNFQARYVTMPGKEKVVKELKQLSEAASEIIIATDPDREGEAIGWHLTKVLKLDEGAACRVRFNEITAPAIRAAVAKPSHIDIDLVNAQQARRILDRLVGYELSPLLWEKVKRGTSAGRVQSVATRLIVDREDEIRNFKSEEYWTIAADLETQSKESFRAQYQGYLEKNKLKKHRPKNQTEVEEILAELKSAEFTVHDLRKGSKKRRPYAPFTTSTLQQEASRRLYYSSKKTMMLAQQLYEGVEIRGQGQTSLVTYIRTDSVRISTEAQKEAKNYIEKSYGSAYLAKKARFYKNKSQSQDAHEAIRPAHFDLPPSAVQDSLSRDLFRLYELIWNRFMASQMADAEIDTLVIDSIAASRIFRSSGERVRFKGFLAAYGDPISKTSKTDSKADDDEDMKVENLPELTVSERLKLQKLDPRQKFTLPPARYTEASLIREMERLGIGRPSTYAPTINTIVDRAHYVEKEERSLRPTELGETVTRLLIANFPEIVDTSFTADMEGWLDQVETGDEDWVKILSNFYPPFHEKIEHARETIQKEASRVEPVGEPCPECGADLVYREGRYGKFIACSKFPDCRYSRPIKVYVEGHCPLCQSKLLELKSKRGKIFYVCEKENDPKCEFISWDLPIDGKNCPICGSYMELHKMRGRGKAQPRCSNSDCETRKRGAKSKLKISEEATEGSETSDEVVETKTSASRRSKKSTPSASPAQADDANE